MYMTRAMARYGQVYCVDHNAESGFSCGGCAWLDLRNVLSCRDDRVYTWASFFSAPWRRSLFVHLIIGSTLCSEIFLSGGVSRVLLWYRHVVLYASSLYTKSFLFLSVPSPYMLLVLKAVLDCNVPLFH